MGVVGLVGFLVGVDVIVLMWVFIGVLVEEVVLVDWIFCVFGEVLDVVVVFLWCDLRKVNCGILVLSLV